MGYLGFAICIVLLAGVAKSEPLKHSYDTSCIADDSGLFTLVLSNEDALPLTFILVCFGDKPKFFVDAFTESEVTAMYFKEDVSPEGACMFKPSGVDGVHAMKLFVQRYKVFYAEDTIYCDTRPDPPRRLLPYETDCNLNDLGRLPITFTNNGDVRLQFKITCWNSSQETFGLEPKSTKSFETMLYDGENKDYEDACVFLPWLDRLQYIGVSTREGDKSWLNYRLHCDAKEELDKPVVNIESTCAPNGQGILPISIDNQDDEIVHFRFKCTNGDLEIDLDPFTSGLLDAMFYLGPDYAYPSDVCVLVHDEDLCGDSVQQTWIKWEKDTGTFSTRIVACETVKSSFHLLSQYLSTCQPNSSGVVPINLINNNEYSVRFTLTCSNGVFQQIVQSGSTAVFPAVFSTLLDNIPDNACVFGLASDGITQQVFVEVTDQDTFLFGTILCDSEKPNPVIPYTTTCEPKDGLVDILLRNDGDVPLMTRLYCRNGDVPLMLGPRSTQIVPAEFYSPKSKIPGACMFIPIPNDVNQRIYLQTNSQNEGPLDHFIQCRNKDQAGPPVPNVELGCSPNKDDLFTLTAHNKEAEDVEVHILCHNKEFDVTVSATETFRMTAVFFQGEGVKYPEVDCLLIDWFPFFGNRQAACFQASQGDNFTVEYVICTKESPPSTNNPEEPIVHLMPSCPKKLPGVPFLEMRADVPAYAVAKCQNGDKEFTTDDDVSFTLSGRFEQDYVGNDCLYYKKDGSNTYTVEVQMGWGEPQSKIIQLHRIKTVSCVYDDHGTTLPSSEFISDWFLSPAEMLTLKGDDSSSTFSLDVVDVLDRVIDSGQIAIGRKIRLRAFDTSGGAAAFRALSCEASNDLNSYAILRAGCGDGLVFKKKSGFSTIGSRVFSPYFDAFKINGNNRVRFTCLFVVCETANCDGDSCKVEGRRKRSADGIVNSFIGSSRPFRLLNNS